MEYMCFTINIFVIAIAMYFAIREFDIFVDGRYARKIRLMHFARYLAVGVITFFIILLDWTIFGITTSDDLYYFITTMKTQ